MLAFTKRERRRMLRPKGRPLAPIDSSTCRLNPLSPLEIFHAFCRLLIFSKLTFKKLFQEYHLSVKQIGSRSGPTVIKSYQQMTLGDEEK